MHNHVPLPLHQLWPKGSNLIKRYAIFVGQKKFFQDFYLPVHETICGGIMAPGQIKR
jgi:hypothetical protein